MTSLPTQSSNGLGCFQHLFSTNKSSKNSSKYTVIVVKIQFSSVTLDSGGKKRKPQLPEQYLSLKC